MRNFGRFGIRILFFGIMIALVATAGTAAAPDGVYPCEWGDTGNFTAGCYGPGMMGGYGYSMMNTRGGQMMEAVESGVMGETLHDEMEDLMAKMMTGNLSAAEQSRIIAIMDQYPAASDMMFVRMSGGYGPGGYGMTGGYGGYSAGGYGPVYGMTGGTGMMDWGFMSAGALFFILFFIVWLVAGILLILWLLQQLKKDKAVS
jgi:hypothetical protein